MKIFSMPTEWYIMQRAMSDGAYGPRPIIENGTWKVEIELAGYGRDNVNVKYQDGSVHVKAVLGKKRRDYNFAINGKQFNVECIVASIKHGLLTITVPQEVQMKNKTIEVNVK